LPRLMAARFQVQFGGFARPESGTRLPHSKTLARFPGREERPPGFGECGSPVPL
jgi:hypothetical protein